MPLVADETSRTALRRMLAEIIRPGLTDKSTRFLDEEIDELLGLASSIEAAAAAGWHRKADRAFDERGGVNEATAGGERTKWVDVKDYYAFCVERAAFYEGLIPPGEDLVGAGTGLAYVAEPPTLGINVPYVLAPAFVDDFTRISEE